MGATPLSALHTASGWHRAVLTRHTNKNAGHLFPVFLANTFAKHHGSHKCVQMPPQTDRDKHISLHRTGLMYPDLSH